MADKPVSKLPTEVELVFEVMPCLSMRETYDSAAERHPCAYFSEWGYYHSYDYAKAGPPDRPMINLDVVYAGKRQVVPELLSGCRKAPILCVGINPNLPGWPESTRDAIHPYFEDVLQYAHYFRYRTREKLRIPRSDYKRLLGDATDDPSSPRPLTEPGDDIPVQPSRVLMYVQYQRLLDGLAERMGWSDHKLAVGEDISYANMVACPSAHWVVKPDSDNPEMPVMGKERAAGIVSECFVERRYFLRQLTQSVPPVILVFSQTTAREFISALSHRFSKGEPKPDERLADLFKREIRLSYGQLSNGTELDARVIFMPHASSNPAQFAKMLGPSIDILEEELSRGNLVYKKTTGHLRRGRGACVFCTNSLYTIGPCDYEKELRPIAPAPVAPLAGPPATTGQRAVPDPLVDKVEQLSLLNQLMGRPASGVPKGADRPRRAAAPPPLILRGKVVPMVGAPIADGAVYIRASRIVAVGRADHDVPQGFSQATTVVTDGVIYPGLLDLHNHLPYNILPLWHTPRAFGNRNDWLDLPEYSQNVGEPMKAVTEAGQSYRKAIIRYIETKALLSGVTSIQGLRSTFGALNGLYRGIVRNFEAPDDPALGPAARTQLGDISESTVNALKEKLDSGRATFWHLAEGIDADAREQFTLADSNLLLRPNLIGIHSLGLRAADHRRMKTKKSWVAWSPLSNLLLYGKTINPQILAEKKLFFTLGCDWTPSGSRNMLMELKVAWLCSQQVSPASSRLSFEDLAKAVTVRAATATGWITQVGTVEPDKLADLLVLDNVHPDPYENLVRATERDVRLVLVGGVARYGNSQLMRQATRRSDDGLEELLVGGIQKRLHLEQQESPLTGVTFADARDQLRAGLADLVALRRRHNTFEPLNGEPRLEIELEMQPLPPSAGGPMLAGPRFEPLRTMALDGPTAIDDHGFFDSLSKVEHLPDYIKGEKGLRRFYPPH
ncbi:amidohydrolase family protein [Mycolicibacterium stellerae]|uniref:amidohydrolase family protein n=1 Tax=Mycolicibacterium stellerae TaxID=2358193 RepID=UPI000F0B8356|nr:amidohydrolase family protein [Mycolicibacterium stellerae]